MVWLCIIARRAADEPIMPATAEDYGGCQDHSSEAYAQSNHASFFYTLRLLSVQTGAIALVSWLMLFLLLLLYRPP
jgi:hypothetical protein